MKIIITTILLFSTVSIFAQIEVSAVAKKNPIGEVTKGGNFVAELYWKQLESGDTVYFLMYQNAEYKHISKVQALSFLPENNALNALYSEFKSFFTNKEKQVKDFSTKVMVRRKEVEVTYLKGSIIIITPDGYFTLNEKQLDKLFGKN